MRTRAPATAPRSSRTIPEMTISLDAGGVCPPYQASSMPATAARQRNVAKRGARMSSAALSIEPGTPFFGCFLPLRPVRVAPGSEVLAFGELDERLVSVLPDRLVIIFEKLGKFAFQMILLVSRHARRLRPNFRTAVLELPFQS